METWFIILLTISIVVLLKASLSLFSTSKTIPYSLPPSPPTFPFIGNFLWIRKPAFQIEQSIRHLRRTLGPILTLHIGPHPSIFVFDRSLAHQALIQNGSLFADRPKSRPANNIMNSNQHNISSGSYGPLWRLFRRNLTSEILHPSRVKSYAHARKWVLDILFHSLQEQAKSGDHSVHVLAHFQYANLCLLGLMCFGDKLSEEQIKEIGAVQRRVLTGFGRFNLLNFWPRITKILLRKQWDQLLKLRKDLEDVFIPLIRARKEAKNDGFGSDSVLAYVDTLLDLELPEEKRKLDEKEIVTLASEFITAGHDSTSTALQWIMANLVKHPHIQERLFLEIKGVVVVGNNDNGVEEIRQDDLQKLPYLKAVVLEGLRRHPPAHMVPHCVTEDTVLGGYLIPKSGAVNFMVADMGWDPTVWEEPMEFKPERFMANGGGGGGGGEVFDITGSREIRMMPFGVGRRICPGLGLALLHLEYFVANLVWRFEWNAMDGDEISLEEKMEFTIVMKTPLMAHITPRKI